MNVVVNLMMKERKVMRFIVTEETMKRYDILNDVMNKKIKLMQASELLGISYRHTLRLFDKFKINGLEGLIKHYHNACKNKKLNDVVEKKIINLYAKTYYDFNILHFKEKLDEYHDIHLSYETIRQLLIKNNIHVNKKRKKIHRRRRRMPKAGLLIQMDSSQHHWLKHIQEKWWLIAGIDDATNEIADASFEPYDTTYANMREIRALIEKKGLFEALYVDKASHFKTTRKMGLNQEIQDEHDETNIAEALKELGITLILANSPQAKGRIERSFRFFQDRLIKEMRLAKIKTYDEANKFLKETFLPMYNKRYTHEAESVYKSLPLGTNLDLIFTRRYERKVKKDNTVRLEGEIIQLPPSKMVLSYTRGWVEIRVRENQGVYVLYKNKIILETKLNKPIKETEMEKRQRYLSQKIIS